jgi:hypothetical protein
VQIPSKRKTARVGAVGERGEGEAMEIKIHCAYDDLVELHRLIPNPRNPNQHPEQQIKLLAEMIKFQGWRVPITIKSLNWLFFYTKSQGGKVNENM